MSTLSALRRILAAGSSKRRIQLTAVMLLTLASAISEIFTIGAVVPVLVIASRSVDGGDLPVVSAFAGLLGASPMVAAATLLALAAITSSILRVLLMIMNQRLTNGLQRDVLLRLFRQTLRQPYHHHIRRHSSELLSALDKISNGLSWTFSSLLAAFTSLIIALAITALIAWIDPVTAALALVVVGFIYVALSAFTQRQAARVSKGLAVTVTERIKTLQDALGGFRHIVLDHSQPQFEARLDEQERRYGRFATSAFLLANLPRAVVEAAIIILIAVVAAWFSLQPGGLTAKIPSLGAIALGAQRLLPMVQQVYSGFAQLGIEAYSLREIAGMLETPVDSAAASEGSVEPKPFLRSVELRDVSFAYRTGRPALNEVNLTIRRGEHVGLIGRTGSGKSTLIDVLTGLLQPDSGEVLVDGTPLRQASLASWKAQIAIVPQALFLSDDSIAANVAFGCAPDEIDGDRVAWAVRQAGLEEVVAGLPEGVETYVGEAGVSLSGGQRQRVGIARALYKKATLLVLDEATSSLDSETEAAVLDAVAGLGPEMTVIIIAHRPSTVAGCDRVVRLSAGRVVEDHRPDRIAKVQG